MKIDRRDFLKLSGMSILALQFTPPELFAAESHITHATHFGAFRAKVQDGRLIGIENFPHDKSPNIALQYMADRLYASNRVQAPPYIRKSYLENKSNPEMRGREPFVKVSWEQALDLVAEKLESIKQEFGNDPYSALQTAHGHRQGWSIDLRAGRGGVFSTISADFQTPLGGITPQVPLSISSLTSSAQWMSTAGKPPAMS